MGSTNNQTNSEELKEICVVATMSKGKSTLINGILQQKIMPSKQEACTALVTRIRNGNNTQFLASVYDAQQRQLAENLDCNLESMNQMNAMAGIAEIHAVGSIPCFASMGSSVLLTDTPGPNNALDKTHGQVQQNYLNKLKNSLIIYVTSGEFGTEDDLDLLTYVKKNVIDPPDKKNSILFVVNKLDSVREEDDNILTMLQDVTSFLSDLGFPSPRIFPASARAALNLRRGISGDVEDALDMAEIQLIARKFNCKESLHFDTLVKDSLTTSSFNTLKESLQQAREETSEKNLADLQTALIHSGIPSIELAMLEFCKNST